MMQDTMLTNAVIVVIAVLFFVLLLILLVIVIDHKARIGGKDRTDLFHITGKRKNHPIWSYLVNSILLIIIGSIGFQLGASILKHTPLTTQDQASRIMDQIAEQREVEQARHFHNSATAMALEGQKSVCYYCHGDFPHFEQRMIRTLLNMHTQFIGCMTCHTDPEKINEDSIELRWLNYSGIDITGPRFGLEYDGDTGYLAYTDDLYSKIVPYLQESGTEKLLEIRESDPSAIDFVKVQGRLDGQAKDILKKSFHRNVSSKGRFCTKCHTEEDKSFIPFRELGFSDRRVNELTSLNIIGLVQKYKKFYMPELMKPDAMKVDINSLMGPDVETPQPETGQDDSKGWWRSSETPADEN